MCKLLVTALLQVMPVGEAADEIDAVHDTVMQQFPAKAPGTQHTVCVSSAKVITTRHAMINGITGM